MGRLNFDRSISRSSALDALAGVALPPSTQRMVVKVYDGGDMPTEPDRVYLCRPAAVSIPSAPAEDEAYTVGVDETQSIPVLFLGRAPAVDDLAIAHRCGGVWVATPPGGPPRGFCPLCSMETHAYLKLTFTFSTGQIAYNAAVSGSVVGSGESREYIWQFLPNPLDGSTSNFSFYPDFYLAHGYISCNKDRTRIWFGGERDVLPVFGRANFIEPIPELDESHVVSCSPLHIVWSGSVPLRYPVAAVGNLVGFEAEEVP
jgi:hypothetical protein